MHYEFHSTLETGGKDFFVLRKSKKRHFRERRKKCRALNFHLEAAKIPLNKCERTMGDNKLYFY